MTETKPQEENKVIAEAMEILKEASVMELQV